MPQNGSIYARQLEQLVEKEIMRPTAPKEIAMFVDHFPDLQIGSDSLLVNISDRVGEANIVGGSTDNVPFVETFYTEDKYPNAVIAAAFKVTTLEMERNEYAKTNRALGDYRLRKINATKEALATKFHLLGCYGSTKQGVYGLFSNPNVPLVDDTFDPYTATAEALADWIVNDQYATAVNNSLLTRRPNTLLVTENLYNRLATTFQAGGQGRSALELIKQAIEGRGMLLIKPLNEITADWLNDYGVRGDNAKERLYFYCKNEDIMFRLFTPVYSLEPQYDNFDIKVIMYQGVSSVVNNEPVTGLYVDYPKKP